MNINHETEIFIKNMMLGVGSVHLSLADPALALRIIEKSYENMQPRTFKKVRPSAKIDEWEKKAVLTELANRFVAYFAAPPLATQAEFDEWHRNTCNWFLDAFNTRVLTPSGYLPIKYGKAQKIVNVAFKYFYLFCDIKPGVPGHFDFAHFTIDSYTLKWYKRVIDPACPVGSWSDMSQADYEKIQDKIRAYIPTSPYPTPFLAEFEIFSREYYGEGDTAAE